MELGVGDEAPPDVAYDDAAGDWFVRAECECCGGYSMGLQVEDPADADLARSRAAAFMVRVHGRGGCLGCEARRWRSGEPPESDQPHVWWDTETDQWMAWHRLPGHSAGASLPLPELFEPLRLKRF